MLLKKKNTNKYMPCPQGRGGRGGSHMEPVEFPNSDKSIMPRLWNNSASAAKALAAWKKGKWIANRGSDYFDDYYEEIVIKPQNHRYDMEMEIVEISVNLP